MSLTMDCKLQRKFIKTSFRHSWLWFLLISLQIIRLSGQYVCPKGCRCTWRDGKQTVTCNNAKFIDIPRDLDPSTQVLDLQNNNLKILPKDAFVDTGLVNLQKVWLTYCKLTQLHRGAFRLLANLVELDLNDNRLNKIPHVALEDVPGLRVLRIARNRLNALSSTVFISTPNLVRLDLSYNNISAIDDTAFRPLSRLEVLKLSGNKLTIISEKVLNPLVALHDFHLDVNPWHCDCLLRPLREWMLSRNVAASIPPTCIQPPRLRDRQWHTLELNEFVCAPHVTAVTQRVTASDGDSVSLACRVRTEFDADVTWLVGDRLLVNTSKSTEEKYKVLELVAPDHNTKLSNLTISSAALQDQGTYRCVVENKAGRAETNLTLQVSKKIIEKKIVSSDQIFLVGALVGTLIFVLVVVFCACIIYQKRKRRKLRINRIKLNIDNETVSPERKGSCRSLTPKDQSRKVVDYHILPTSDIENDNSLEEDKERTWMLRDTSIDDFAISKDLEANNIYSKLPLNKSISQSSHQSVSADSSKAVSYVEIPKQTNISSNREQFEDPLLKNLAYQCKEAVLRRDGRPTLQPKSVTKSHPFPDLLEFPRNQHTNLKEQQPTQNEVIPMSYCTIPRGMKQRRQSLTHYDNIPDFSFPEHSTTERTEDTSFTLNNVFKHPGMANNRSSSAINLAMMESLIGQHPSIHNAPIHQRQALQEYFNANRSDYFGDEKLGAVGGSLPFNYEYHAAQLEHFLQEYKTLQDQLFRMKQSCDSARANNANNNIRETGLLPDPNSNDSVTERTSNYTSQNDSLIHQSEPLKSILKTRRGSTGRISGPIGQGSALADDPTKRLLQTIPNNKDYFFN